MPKSDTDYLKSIDKTLKDIHKLLDRSIRKRPAGDLTAEVNIDGKEFTSLVVDNIEREFAKKKAVEALR